MKTMETISHLLFVLLQISALGLGDRTKSPCGQTELLGPCRLIEPCKPNLLSWNKSFIIVSWEGLFQDCHEDQINQMYVKVGEVTEGIKVEQVEYKNISFGKSQTFLEKKLCENSKIALRIDFNEDHINARNTQQRDLHTHYNDCANIISTKSDTIILVSSVSAGVLFIVIIIILVVVVVLKKRCCKIRKRNVDMDVDVSPVYGDYYYQDGGRRQNVVEVSKANLCKP